jgi:hypothetical protein
MNAIVSRSLVATLFALGAGASQAASPVVGAVVGAGAGAAVGHAVAGPEGAAVGGAIGAFAGATIAHRHSDYYRPAPVVVTSAPRMTRVHYNGPNHFVGAYPPPPRHGGQWRGYYDSWGAPYWIWEPAVVYVQPPPRIFYGTPLPAYQPPIWVPPRHAAPIHQPGPPVYYGPPPGGHRGHHHGRHR